MKEELFDRDENLQKAERVAYLIAGHIGGTLTEEERSELDDWITESDANLALFEKLTDEENIDVAMQQYLQMEKEKAAALEGVKRKLFAGRNGAVSLWPYLIAACVLLFIAGIYYFKSSYHKTESIAQGTTKNEIPPGSDKAVLSLSDGRTILLDSGNNVLLAKEQGVSISEKNGEIIYNGTGTEMRYNVVSTPRGGHFKITLGDGTRVWLNAESSLKFPAGLGSSDRNVELRGEGYFEVAKNPLKPFTVLVREGENEVQRITVLGTHFNVNAYGDENLIFTTLLEGSVSVARSFGPAQDGIAQGDESVTIKPGEQAQGDILHFDKLSVNSAQDEKGSIKVVKVDVNDAIAWRDGRFLFRDASAVSIGEQIKRWYDVDVDYQGTIAQHFNTEINRNLPLSKVLDALEGTGQMHFILQGKKLIIKP